MLRRKYERPLHSILKFFATLYQKNRRFFFKLYKFSGVYFNDNKIDKNKYIMSIKKTVTLIIHNCLILRVETYYGVAC